MKRSGELSHRMAEQRWLIDKVIEACGVDSIWPITPFILAATGPDVAEDMVGMRLSIRKYADISRECARVAAKREAMAKRAEDEGHFVTARDNYFSAAVCYGFAQWPFHEDDNEKNIAYNVRKIECMDRFIKHAPRPIERVEIPFEGKSLPAFLHLPPNSSQKVPCVINIPGMDIFKEQQTPVYGSKYIERGLAVLSIDGPGQSEAIMRKIRYTADNFAQAGRAAMDFLIKRPEIDADRIAITGESFGSFWATQIVANDDRLAGYEDEGEFDKFAQTLTLKGLGARIKCPFLIIAGEDDHLSPIENSYNLYDEIVAPKKIMVYEGKGHGFSLLDVEALIADWLSDRLEGKPMQSETVYVDMMGRETKGRAR